ncbi:MAG: cbb3-type cytochrome c oxidase subunit I [Microthrixaceae bacterium]
MAVTDTMVEAPPEPAELPAAPAAAPVEAVRAEITAVERVIGAVDHKVVGRLYLVSGALFAVAAFTARMMGWAGEGGNPMLGTWSAQVRESADVAVILLGLMPLIVGLAIYVVPLQVGARGISFPRLVSLSFYGWLVSALVFAASVLGDGGLGGKSLEMNRLGLFSLAAGAGFVLAGMIAVMTTVLTLRAPGMTLARTPMFSYSILVTGAVWLATVPAVFASAALAQAGRLDAAALQVQVVDQLRFLGWQPAIWMIAIPLVGLAVDVVPVATNARLQQRFLFRGLIVALGIGAFGVWALDLEVAANTVVWSGQATLALLAVLATVGGLTPALRRSQGLPGIPVSLLGVLTSLGLALLAALVGFAAALNTLGGDEEGLLGLPTVNGLIAGQANLVLGAVVSGLLGALAYWGVKITGKPSAKLPPAFFGLLAALGGLLAGAGPIIDAVASVNGGDGAEVGSSALVAVGSLVMAMALLGAAALIILEGRTQGGPSDPFSGHTLEWLTQSPPAPENFEGPLPEVLSASPLLDAREAGTDAEGIVQ